MGQERKSRDLSRRDFIKTSLATVAGASIFPIEDEGKQKEKEKNSEKVLGLYFPFHYLIDKERVGDFKNLVLQSGANSIVVDVKNESGLCHVSFEHQYKSKLKSSMESPNAMSELLNWAVKNGIYMIGRVVVMPDKRMLGAYPHLALRTTRGGVWEDMHGQPWANPYKNEVASYNAAIAEAAVMLGFDEVNADYIRFPSGDSETEAIKHSQYNNFDNRTNAIASTLKIMSESVKEAGGDLTVDFFGGTAWKEHKDMGIGQYVESVAPYVDGIYPMAYPSLYGSRWRGIPEECRVGTECPYDIVYLTTKFTKERLEKFNPRAVVRPWIQAFPDYRYGIPMGLDQYREQQEGAFDAGASGVLAWNPRLKYHPDFYKKATTALPSA